MSDFCNILKVALPEDNKMWTWKHVQNLVDAMGTWRVGQDYHRYPLCYICHEHIFEENDYGSPCPNGCNESKDETEQVISI